MTAFIELITPPKRKKPPPIPVQLAQPLLLPMHAPLVVGNGLDDEADLQLHGPPFLAFIEKRREGWVLRAGHPFDPVGPLDDSAYRADAAWILEDGQHFALGAWTFRFADDVTERFGRAWRAGGWNLVEPARAAPVPLWRACRGNTLGDALVFGRPDLADLEAKYVVNHPAVPPVIDRVGAVLVRADASGPSFFDVMVAGERQRGRLDSRMALHAIACVAEACDAGHDVPCIAIPATMVFAWDGRVLFTGFGREPVARGPLSAEPAYLADDAPANWRRRTGSTTSFALGRILAELVRGMRDGTPEGRGRLDPVVRDVVTAATQGALSPAQLAAEARARAGLVEEREVAAVMRALFAEAWRREEALRDERLSF